MSLHILWLGLGVQTVTIRVGGGQFLKRFRVLSGLIEKQIKGCWKGREEKWGREIENKEEWCSELGFGEGEQKFWVSGLIL